MDSAWIGIGLMLSVVGLLGIAFGSHASRFDDNPASYSDPAPLTNTVVWTIALFLYFVGALTFQPTIMTLRYYSPLLYAGATVSCGIGVFVVVSGAFYCIFTAFITAFKWLLK